MTTNSISQLKSQAKAEIECRRDVFATLSHNLHSHPEIAMQEYQAMGWITEALESEGFSIQRGICELPTAFRAVYGKGKPVIAFIAEYDALPGLGHACGHNLIATAAVAAAIGAKGAADTLGGSIQVIGTPAEELTGGKIVMVERGAFKGLDAAMMLHPAAHDSATITALACIPLDVEFFGRESHAAAHPELGINALDAMILAYNGISALRQQLPGDVRIHGVITDGGQAANIIPCHSAAHFLLRSNNRNYMPELREKVLSCFKGAAQATDARLEYKWEEDSYYAPMLNNHKLAELYIKNMAEQDVAVPFYDDAQSFGSTDMGNLSQAVPAIHTSVAIAPHGTSEHTPEFARLAAADASLSRVLQAASALSMTAIDLLSSPVEMEEVNKEFARGTNSNGKHGRT
jgi:amidohydrolase